MPSDNIYDHKFLLFKKLKDNGTDSFITLESILSISPNQNLRSHIEDYASMNITEKNGLGTIISNL